MILAILQARMSSSRLPGKVLKPLLGKPMLFRQVERIRRSQLIDDLLIATSDDVSDDAIAMCCEENNITCFRGSLHDVLGRYYQAASAYNPDHVVRLTGDCPLGDPDLMDIVIRKHLEEGNDYTSNISEPTFPDGLDIEIFTFSSLKEAALNATLPFQREHVTPYMRDPENKYRIGDYKNKTDLSELRWTVDEKVDYQLISKIYSELYPVKPNFTWKDVLKIVKENPDMEHSNKHLVRSPIKDRYQKSKSLLKRALKVIPTGSQTFSKSYFQYPENHAPLFLARGEGGRVWDVDNNEFVDLVNGLLPVVLGYKDKDVDNAIKQQLENGISFSLSTELEVKLSEALVDIIPCAEMVRFGKNGSDATTAAIRLARAFTGRERVAVCGYHGWHDWYVAVTSRFLGVPKSVCELTHRFEYNNLDSLYHLLRAHPGEFAAVIMEPMNVSEPYPDFLNEVKTLAHQEGALFILDEIITGFRYGLGGAQELFSVTPDLATFGKAMGNGMPISAIVGRADVMSLFEDVFISGTFGGEALSMAAAIAVIDKMKREPVIESLWEKGKFLADSVLQEIQASGLQDVVSLKGKAPWMILQFSDFKTIRKELIRTIFIREMLSKGVLIQGSHNVSYAHTQDDLSHVIHAYRSAFQAIKPVLEQPVSTEDLGYPVIEPVFQVR